MSLIEDTRKELKVTQTIVMNVREDCVDRKYEWMIVEGKRRRRSEYNCRIWNLTNLWRMVRSYRRKKKEVVVLGWTEKEIRILLGDG